MEYNTTEEYVKTVLKAMDKEQAEKIVLECLCDSDRFMDNLAEIAEKLGLQWED